MEDTNQQIRGCDLDEAVRFVEQKASDLTMLSFNINSLYATFQYVVSVDGWKHPEELSSVLNTLTSPLFEKPVPEAYTPQVSSNLKHLFESFVNRPYLMEQLDNELVHRILSLIRHYCHICNEFIVDDTLLSEHMLSRHSLPACVRYVPMNPSFLNALHTQCVMEYHSLCPKEQFYTSRYGSQRIIHI